MKFHLSNAGMLAKTKSFFLCIIIFIMPAVYGVNSFNPVEDARNLQQAFQGWGCDAQTIVDIITKRSNAQRIEIATQYKASFGEDLIEELESELIGNFEDVMVALMIQPMDYYATQLYEAISGFGTDENTLLEILALHNNSEIVAIREAYKRMYGVSLESDIIGDTSDCVKNVLVSLASANRDESDVVDVPSAYEDASKLLLAGELIPGTIESVFNEILCKRSKKQVQLIFDQYYILTGYDFENAIEKEFSGTIKEVLLGLVKCIKSPVEYLAERLYKSMDGNGTDDTTLIRIVVSRSEIDLGGIKEAFYQKYNATLQEFIIDDTSGDYQNSLLAIIR